MNFKALAFSAFVAISSLGGAAQAAPTTCAFVDNSGVEKFTCDHSIRRNANNTKVNDVVFFENGNRIELSIIFWTEDGEPVYAEMFNAGDRVVTDAYIAKNGMWCVENNGTKFCLQ